MEHIRDKHESSNFGGDRGLLKSQRFRQNLNYLQRIDSMRIYTLRKV